MNQKVAQWIFVVLNIFAIFAIAYVAYDFVEVNRAINEKEDFINFDTGTYYLLLMSVFWVLVVVKYTGLRNEHSKLVRYATQIGVYWFVLMLVLVLANLIPYYITHQFEVAGFTKCKDPHY
jgi:hypothetical protein